MPVGEGDARVDEGAGGELRAGLFCRALEGEMGEGGVGGMRAELDVVQVGGAALDLAYYEVAYGGDVLFGGGDVSD